MKINFSIQNYELGQDNSFKKTDTTNFEIGFKHSQKITKLLIVVNGYITNVDINLVDFRSKPYKKQILIAIRQYLDAKEKSVLTGKNLNIAKKLLTVNVARKFFSKQIISHIENYLLPINKEENRDNISKFGLCQKSNSELIGLEKAEFLKTNYGLDIDNLIVVNSNIDHSKKQIFQTYKGSSFRPSYTYAHGKLEAIYGYDVLDFKLINNSFSAEKAYLDILNILPQGIYKSKDLNGKTCIWFLWSPKESSSIRRKKGLIVYHDDIQSINYALKCYLEKTETL